MITCHLGCGRLPGDNWTFHYRTVHVDQINGDRTPQQWERSAHALILDAAASGREFTIAEVLEPLGPYPIPGKRQFVNGRITNTIAGEGLIEHADAQKSLKRTSNKSLVYRWVGTDKARSNAA